MENQTNTRINSDDEIIQSILNGEMALFELLIRRYNTVLYKIARSYGFNHQDAQDLMQDTHVAAYENLKQFGGKASYKTWISKIIIHKCLYRLNYGHRKYEIQEEEITVKDNQPLYMKAETQLNDSTVNKELGMVLEKSLDTLPLLYRNVFVLRELEGFSTKETAELLNISEVNVKVRMNRAKTLLQQEILKVYNHSEVYSFNLVFCDEMVRMVFDRIQKPVS